MRRQTHPEFGKSKPSKTPNETVPGKTAHLPGLKPAEKLREILRTRNMSLLQVSKESRRLFPGQSLYHIPHNLYYDLRDEGFTPNIYQLIALSRVSGYSLIQWLSVFGLHLDDIPRLQIHLTFPQTILLDSTIYDDNVVVPWFEGQGKLPSQIAPLAQILVQGNSERLPILRQFNTTSFLYAKVGRQDDFSFPELFPGSIVRVDPRNSEIWLRRMSGRVSRDFFLVKHARGLNCCRLQQVAPRRVVLVSTKLTAPRLELQVGSELQILGTIDMEIRRFKKESPALSLATREKPKSQEFSQLGGPHRDLHHLLRQGRQSVGLSFRQASAMSREIARNFGDQRYFTAIGSLSDYESSEAPPRHIHKVMTLCVLYSVGFWQFLKAAGLSMEKLGQEAIPDDLEESTRRGRRSQQKEPEPRRKKRDALAHILAERFEEVPWLLRSALSELCGMSRVSVRDVFWAGEMGHEFHAPLRGAAFFVVNRRRKTPVIWKSEPQWKQPVYLLARRDGTFFCARFDKAEQPTVLHPLPAEPQGANSVRFRNEGEIVGEIVTVLRRISLER